VKIIGNYFDIYFVEPLFINHDIARFSLLDLKSIWISETIL